MHKDALGIPSQNNKNTHWTCILDDRKWQLKDKSNSMWTTFKCLYNFKISPLLPNPKVKENERSTIGINPKSSNDAKEPNKIE